MPDKSLFQKDFDALASGGVIGAPDGEVAYAYIRVSHSSQAEDGRSGLPRQIEHIHVTATKHGLAVPWELVYADDHSGFQFEDRPALSELRREFKRPDRRANNLIIEHLDRLSRNADWHQGFLLDEMRRYDVTPLFWKEFHSRIERAVMGAIAQDGMEQSFERMREGTLKKAKRGCITAKIAAFGYKFVDENGDEGTANSRKNTYYAIREDQAYAVRFMFDAIAYRGMSSYELLKEVDELAKQDERFRSPRGGPWNSRTFIKMLRNPLYKGEFIANRHYKEKVTVMDEHGAPKTVLKSRQRPESEWIRVKVPAIVDVETWDAANHNLFRNKGFARRNKKYEYLLTDLIRCATCGRRYHGHTENKPKKIQRYYCATIHLRPAQRAERPCGQGSVRAEIINRAVWEIITESLLNSELIAEAIDERYASDQIEDVRQQIAFLERSIPAKDEEEHKLKQAYLAGAYDAQEFAAERQRLKAERETLRHQLKELGAQVISPEELEERKQATKSLIDHVRSSFNFHEVPFELKQKIVRLLIDEVVVNTTEGWFEVKGMVGEGLFRLSDTTPVVRLSNP